MDGWMDGCIGCWYIIKQNNNNVEHRVTVTVTVTEYRSRNPAAGGLHADAADAVTRNTRCGAIYPSI